MEINHNMLLKALVVDDNEVNALVLTNMLELFGISVDQAYSGKKAVHMSLREEYDIIFIDHIMPVMDGIQTTTSIRSLARNNDKITIFALTSSIPESIKKMYERAGANDVLTKPLGISQLHMILKQWFPMLSADAAATFENRSSSQLELENIKSRLVHIHEIEFDIGIRYAVGNPSHYMRILKVSLKDIQSSIKKIEQCYKEYLYKDIAIVVHNLKSVFTNIGAIGLSEETKFMESMIAKNEMNNINLHLSYYLHHLESFQEKLTYAIRKYEITKLSKIQGKKVYTPMSQEEYEQSISNTIYYIRRFEYDSIMRELKLLIHCGIEQHQKEFMKALDEIRDFNYENALDIIMQIKEKR